LAGLVRPDKPSPGGLSSPGALSPNTPTKTPEPERANERESCGSPRFAYIRIYIMWHIHACVGRVYPCVHVPARVCICLCANVRASNPRLMTTHSNTTCPKWKIEVGSATASCDRQPSKCIRKFHDFEPLSYWQNNFCGQHFK
jgi:hypothetical protein